MKYAVLLLVLVLPAVAATAYQQKSSGGKAESSESCSKCPEDADSQSQGESASEEESHAGEKTPSAKEGDCKTDKNDGCKKDKQKDSDAKKGGNSDPKPDKDADAKAGKQPETKTPADAKADEEPLLLLDDEPPLLLDDEPLLLLDDEEEGSGKSQKPVADNSRCHHCHLNYLDEDIAVVHARANIGCTKCHGKCDEHIADESWASGGNGTAPELMYPRETINPFCHRCHEPEKMDHEKHKAFFAGKTKEKYCTDCHGDHRLHERKCKWK